MAKDLISKMLEKEPSRRLTIVQVKEHKWMLDHPPMRATITQELQPKPLPDLNAENPNIPKGYVVISKQELTKSTESTSEEEKTPTKKARTDSESTDEVKTPPQNSYRQSIVQMKQTLSQKEVETKQARQELMDQTQQISKNEENIKILEEKIADKRKEYGQVSVSEKELLLKISDINLELEKLESLYEGHATIEKNTQKSKDLMEKTNEVKFSRKNLTNLRDEVKAKSLEINEKEKTLNSLQLYLRKLLDEAQYEGNEKKSKISELSIDTDVLRTRIESKNKDCKEFGCDERAKASEIMNYIQSRYSEISTPLGYLEEKILKSEETLIETEQLLSYSKFEFEEKRAMLVHGNRRKKDDIVKNARKMADDIRETWKFQAEKAKQELKDDLNEARKLEIQYFVEPIEIDHAKEKIGILAKDLLERRARIDKIKIERFEKTKKINLKKRDVEDIEMEIGTLKAQILHNPQIYDL